MCDLYDVKSSLQNINFDRLKINRETLIQKLYKQNIITQVHYIPTFNQPIYKKFLDKKRSLKTVVLHRNFGASV